MANNSFNFSCEENNFFGNSQSKNFNTNTSHPLIQNSQEYMYYSKYVSIHSEDRNILKYPNPAEFEIEIPEDLSNVAALRLVSWNFPSNYNVFSSLNNNVTMSFSINNPYNPNINNVTILLIQKIFEYLFLTQTKIYQIIIENGNYTPQQMAIELTNKFNYTITTNLIEYFTRKSKDPSLTPSQQSQYITAISDLNANGGYTNFVIVYNEVSKKLWFGNICDEFTLENEAHIENNALGNISPCINKGQLPDFSDWGLPGNLGLNRCNISSNSAINSTNIVIYNGNTVPRFFYGNVFPQDNGYWLLPNPTLTNSSVNWVECLYKINLDGPGYIYMELQGQNCIDETSPFNVSSYTLGNSTTNGIVNSAFAKIPLNKCCETQCIDSNLIPYKFYYPPAERMRRFYIKFRYHNGKTVIFEDFNYSFVLEFSLQMSQILRSSNSVVYPKNFNSNR